MVLRLLLLEIIVTALEWRNSIEVIQLRLANGADNKAVHNHGRTILYTALENRNSVEVVKWLLDNGAVRKASC